MKNILILIIPIALFLFSCSEDSTGPKTSDKASEFMPLEVGRYWVRNTYEYNPDGSVKERVIGSVSDTIKRKAAANGEEVYIISDAPYVAFRTEESSLYSYLGSGNVLKNLDLSKESWEQSLGTYNSSPDENPEYDKYELVLSFKRQKIENIEFNDKFREAQKVIVTQYRHYYNKQNEKIKTDTFSNSQEIIYLKGIGIYSTSDYYPDGNNQPYAYGSYQVLVETGVK